MQIIGLVGSPRKGMNTDVLVRAILDGCERKGAQTDIMYLNDLIIKPCQACRTQDGKGCTIRDGMDAVYRAFEQADGLVIGTPVYYSAVSSQIKLMIDRSYCLARPITLPSGKTAYQSTVAKRKQGILVCVAGGLPNEEWIWASFEDWAIEVNLKVTQRLFISHADEDRAPKDRKELLDRLILYGEELCKTIAKAQDHCVDR